MKLFALQIHFITSRVLKSLHLRIVSAEFRMLSRVRLILLMAQIDEGFS